MPMSVFEYGGPIISSPQDPVRGYIPRRVPTSKLFMKVVDNLMGIFLCNALEIYSLIISPVEDTFLQHIVRGLEP